MSPAQEYSQRLSAREALVAHHEKLHIRLGNFRLALVLASALMIWLSIGRHSFSVWWLAAPVGAFLAIAVYHSRILRARDCAERAAEMYRKGLARIEDRWVGMGQTGDRFNDPHHVNAADLDLFGRGSLFELLSIARTRMGEDTLAKWLLNPLPLDQIRERHEAISELRNQLDFREELSVLGEDAAVGVHPEALAKWAESINRMEPLSLEWLAPALAVLAVAALVVWGVWGIVTPLIVVIVIEAIISYRVRNRVDEVLHGTEHAFGDLELLSGVLTRVERQTFHAPPLQALQTALSSHHVAGSRAIARLRSIVDLINSRDNLILRLLDMPLMYSVQVALAAERWRRSHGRAVQAWIGAIGAIEALLSLAAYSYEHPADPLPELTSGAACFEAQDMGHPLLPAANCVRNHVNLGGDQRGLLVSGSNMSGKSTLLRAVGLNAVLAMAGGPVRACHLRLTPLRVGASIRINDSLQEGSSRFYAEITRLRQIFDLAGKDPALLFLLDELLQGTNSNDRRVGAEGIVRALLEQGSIGLVSTHDLALTNLSEPLDRHIHNMHFQDEMENGKMKFDYKLQDGVVTKNNGLALMRSIGLDV